MSDYTVVYFKALSRGFSIPSTLVDFSIGKIDFEVKWYGVFIAIGYILALLFCTRLAKRAKIDVDALYDAIIFGTIGGIVGARTYYVLFNLDYYLQYPNHILAINEGGLAIYGGIIGALLVALIVCKVKKLHVLDVFDLAVVGFFIGQGVGRWGNFTNQEAFGTNTNLPWGMMSSKTIDYIADNQDFFEAHGLLVSPYEYVHPTFLYESLWCIAGFIVLYFMFRNWRHFRGQIFLSYGVLYGLERGLVEGLRTDSLYIANTSFRISQVLSIALAVVCLVLLIIGLVKKKDSLKEDETYEQESES